MTLVSRWLLVSSILLLCSVSSQAQIPVTVDVPTNTTPNLAASYPSLAAALTDLNLVTAMSGPVILTLTGPNAETAPPTGLVIGSATLNPALGAGTSVTFVSSGGAVTLNAGVGTATPGSAAPDGILRLAGADYITLNGITFTDGNAANPATMEFGIGMFKLSATDGCNNNTITNCTTNMKRINFAAGTAPMVDGSVGIGIYNSIHGTATTVLTVTAASGANSNNKIYTNSLNDGNIGIAVIGFAASFPYTLADQGNDIGGSSALTGNTILNYGGGASATTPAAAVRTLAQYGLNVSYNTINSNNGAGVKHVSTLRGIYTNTAAGASETVNFNNISIHGGGTTSQIAAIENVAGSGGGGNSLSFNNNTVTTTYTTATSGITYGIYNNGGSSTTCNINSNVFNISSACTSGSTYAINQIGAVVTTSNINTNTISFNLTAATTSVGLRGISVGSSSTTQNLTINGNNFTSYTFGGTTVLTGTIAFVYSSSTQLTQAVTNNTVTNLSIPASTATLYFFYVSNSTPTQTVSNNSIVTGFTRSGANSGGTTYGIYSFGAPGTGLVNVNDNNLSNITMNSSTGSCYGIYWGSSGTNQNVYNNTVSNINNTNATGTGTFYGMYLSSGSNLAYNNTVTNITWPGGVVAGIYVAGGTTQNVYNNFVNTFSSSAVSSTVYGLYVSSGTTVNVYNNAVHTLTGTGTTAPIIYGVGVTGGTTVNIYNNSVCNLSETGIINVNTLNYAPVVGLWYSGGTTVTSYNNRVGDLRAPASFITSPGVDAIRGISVVATGASTSYNFYNNTINVSAATGGTNFGTAGIFHVANAIPTTASLTLKNNIIVNTSVVNGGGNTVVFRRSVGTAGTLNNYNSASNYNDFYVTGGPAAVFPNYVYNDGTSIAFTMAAYKASVFTAGTVAPRDQASFDVNPLFQSTTCGNANFLRPTYGIVTQLESGGDGTGLPFTTDFEAEVRAGNGGYLGTGSSYDVGADEFAGLPATPTITSVTAAPSGTQCVATARTISADITPTNPLSTAPTLNYAFNGVAQTPIAMTGGSLVAQSIWTATLPAATPGNAVVTFSVFATDGTLSKTKSGTSYSDQPNDIYTASASASPNPVCAYSQTTLTAVVGGPQTSPVYPAPGAVSNPTVDEDFGNITITQGASTVLNNTTAGGSLVGTIGTATGTGGSYSNFSAFGPYTLGINQVYSLSVTSITQGGNFGNAMAVYIDLNRDGDFLDAGENVYNQGATITGPHTSTGTITIPASASPGVTRLRVGVNEGTITSPIQAFTWGEWEDYSVNLGPVVTAFSWSNGASVVSTSNPAVAYPPGTTTYTVTATANNCPMTASVVVTTNPIPSAPIANPGVPQCGTAIPSAAVASVTSTTLLPSPVFAWFTTQLGGTAIAGETGSNLTLTSVSSTTTFYVSEFDPALGCQSQRTPVVVNVISPDAVTASSSANNICPYVNVDLIATKAAGPNTYTYSWSASPSLGSGTPASGSPATIQATLAGTYTYTVTATDASLGCATTSTVVVTFNTAPIITVTPATSTVCPNTPVQLNVSQSNGAGNAMSFSGTNQWIAVPQSASINLSSAAAQSFTLEAWVNQNAYVFLAGIISHYQTSTAASYFLRASSASPYSGLSVGGATEILTPAGGIPLATWKHVAAVFTYNATNLNEDVTIYIDGVLAGSGAVTVPITPDSLRIGSDFGGRFFNGKMDEVRIWGSALSASTLNAWKNKHITASHPNYASLALYYDFDAATTTTVTDLSSNGNTGYLRGASNQQPTQVVSTAPVSYITGYSWSPTSDLDNSTIANPIATILTAGTTTTYTVTATGPNGCTAKGTSVINTLIPPAAPSIISNTPQCGYGVPNATVSTGGFVMRWYLTPTGGTPLAGQSGTSLTGYNISTTTTFYVAEYDGSCESARTTVVAVVNQPDAITASASSPACTGTLFTLSVSKAAGPNTYSYSWNGGSANSGVPVLTAGDVLDGHLDATPLAAGTYTYTVLGTDGVAGCVAITTISVTVSDYPVIDSVRAAPTAICSGQLVTLNAYSSVVGSGPQTQPTGYLASNATSTADEELLNVTFGTLNNTSACGFLAPGAGSIAYMYSNYTGSVAAPTVVAGAGVPFSVQVGTCGGNFGNKVSVFIDYNRNGVFDVATESAYVQATSVTGPQTVSGTITIPLSAATGVTRMRVVNVETSGTILPTGTYTWGETEDYIINILNIVPQNAALTYSWSAGVAGSPTYTATDNPTNLSAIPSTASYTVTVTRNGCASLGTTSVTVNPLPTQLTVQDDSQCGPGIPTAYITNGGAGVFRWYLSQNAATPIAGETGTNLTAYSISTTTTFWVSEYDGTCESTRTPVVQTVTGAGGNVTAAASVGCAGSLLNLTLTQTGGPWISFDWTANPAAGSGLPSLTAGDPVDGHLNVTPTVAGTYTYSVLAYDGGICYSSSNVVVTVNAPPALDSVRAVPSTVCSGSPVALTAYSAIIGAGPTTPPSGYCVVTNAGSSCVTNVQIATMNHNPPVCATPYYHVNDPIADPTSTTTLISGQSYTMTLTTGGTSIISVWIDYNRDGIYDASEWVQPWISAATGTVTINVPLTASPGATGMRIRSRLNGNQNGAGDACLAMGSGSTEDYTITLLALVPINPALTYSWSPAGSPAYTTTVNPLNGGALPITATYTVTVSNGTCSTSGSVTVTVNPLPATPTSTSSSQCGSGIPDAYVTGGGGTFNWYLTPTGGTPIAGESGANLLTYSISTTTTFYVAEYDGSCESARVAVIQSVVTPDVVTINASAAPYCANSVINLTQSYTSVSNTYNSWLWSASPATGSGIAAPTYGDPVDGHLDVTPTAAGTYTYTLLSDDGLGCAYTSVIVITVGSVPALQATASSSQICGGNSTTLSATSLIIGSGPQTPPTGYLTSNATSSADEEILSVTFDALSQSSICGTLAPGAGSIAYMYSNYTGVAAPTVNIGAAVPFSVQVGTCGGNFSNKVSVFIDYNRNGVFDIATESAYVQATAISGPHTETGFITIPNTASAGVTLMRVVNVETTGTVNPSGTYTWGETEDYLINIQSLVQNPGVTYVWTPGPLSGTPQTVSPAVSTTYVVTATDGSSGCTSSASVPVTVINASTTPIVIALSPTLCNTGSTELVVINPDAGVTYNWEYSPTGAAPWTPIGTGASSTNTGTINATSYYQVTASCGTSSATSLVTTVTVDKPVVASATGGTRCGPGIVNPSVLGTGSFDWYTGSTGGTPIATNQSTIAYVVTVPSTTLWVQAYIGTCNAVSRYPVSVGFTPSPAVAITAPSTTCDNQPITLTASSPNDPNYAYSWSTNGGQSIVSTNNPYNVNPLVTTTYTLLANDPGTNCGNVATHVVTVRPSPPVPVIVPAAPAVCSTGGCVNLAVQGATVSAPGPVYVGDPSTGLANGTTSYPSPYGQFYTGTREQILVLGSELQAQGMVAGNITQLAFDVVAPPGPFTVGNLSSLPLQNFKISIGTTGLSALTTSFQSGLTQVYSVATYAATAGLNVHTFNSGSFLWDGVSNIIVETCYNNDNGSCPTGSTNYGTNATHKYTVTPFVSVIDAHADGSCTICANATGTTYSNRPNIQFTGITGSPITYTWNPGSIVGTSINPCPTANTTYTVVASLANGCTSSASVGVVYSPIPDPTITGNASICPGGSTLLDAGAGYTNYSWSDGASVVATTQTYSASPAATTTYTVTVDNGALCTKSASHVLTVASLSAPTVIGGTSPICAGSSVTLDAGSPYDTYSWSDGAGVVGTSQTYVASPTTTTTYTVTVTLNGCSATSSGTEIIVNPVPPTALITPAGPINLCDNGSNSPVTLTSDITGAGAGATIVWNQDGNPSTATIPVSAGDIDLFLNGGTFGYNFQVTNSFGCSTTSNTVTVNEVPCSGPTAFVKVFIECYYSTGGLMENATYGGASSPLFGGCLYHNFGAPYVSTDVDSVTISLFNPLATPPIWQNGFVESKTGILQTNGSINVTFSNAVASGTSYWICVNHRNSIETWSAAPVLISATTALLPYDFTTGPGQAYGNNLAENIDLLTSAPDGTWGMFSGDISDETSTVLDPFGNPIYLGYQDDIISSQDYGDMENAVYVTKLGYVPEDITGDGIVESADYGCMENNVYFTRVTQRP